MQFFFYKNENYVYHQNTTFFYEIGYRYVYEDLNSDWSVIKFVNVQRT